MRKRLTAIYFLKGSMPAQNSSKAQPGPTGPPAPCHSQDVVLVMWVTQPVCFLPGMVPAFHVPLLPARSAHPSLPRPNCQLFSRRWTCPETGRAVQCQEQDQAVLGAVRHGGGGGPARLRFYDAYS